MRLNTILLLGVTLLLASLLLAFLSSEDAGGETIIVSQDGSGNYTKIQDAVDASQHGDTIRVFAGTYHENVVVDRSVELVGNGSADTIINGSRNGNVVILKANEIHMEGFRVERGGNLSAEHAGIRVESYDVTIHYSECWDNMNGFFLAGTNNVILMGNRGSDNARDGIYMDKATASTLFDNLWKDNHGVGIFMNYTESVLIEENHCWENALQGIYSGFSANDTLENNTVLNNGHAGIWLTSGQNMRLLNNTVSDNGDNGIVLFGFGSEGVTVEGNELMYNDGNGLTIDLSNNCRVTGNTISENDRNGIDVTTSDGNIIELNSMVSNGWCGIWLTRSEDNLIHANTCDDHNLQGIGLYGGSHGNIIDGNTIDGNDDAGILLEYSHNNSIERNSITATEISGIFLDTSHNTTIANNTSSGSENGIKLITSHNNTITSNSCQDNEYGIFLGITDFDSRGGGVVSRGTELQGCAHNIIENNNCSESDYGIHLEESYYNSLEKNVCDDGKVGIYLKTSENNTVGNNSCLRILTGGIWVREDSHTNTVIMNVLSGSDDGILVENSDYMYIGMNTVTETNLGIQLDEVMMSTVENNTCIDNGQGINIIGSKYNEIIYNYCSFNEFGILLFAEADWNTIEWNIVTENYQGILSSWCSHNTFGNNSVYENGVFGIMITNFCFLGGTQVLMADLSEKPIEEVEPGDLVRSYDPEGSGFTVSIVHNTFHHENVESYLVINDGLRLTPNHPMYVNGEWMDAGDIQPGDLLLKDDGSLVPVTSLEVVFESVAVYNLEVSGPHTYFADGFLTHNKCPRIYSDTGDGYQFDVLINVGADGEEKDNLFEYPLKHLEEPSILVKYDPNEINYIDFIKLIIEDSPVGDDDGSGTGEGRETRIHLLDPIECTGVDFECDLSLLMERDGNYLLSDALHKEFYLEFEEFPALEPDYERTIKIFSSGYQVYLDDIDYKCDSDEEYAVYAFLEEYFSKENKNPYDDRFGRKYTIGNSHNYVIHNEVFHNGFLEDETFPSGGIVLWMEDNTLVSDNDVYMNTRGIVVVESYENRILDNDVHQNEDTGIWMDDTQDMIIDGNDCNENQWGIFVWDSIRVNITGNDCSNNSRDGIDVLGSQDVWIGNNICTNMGITGIYLNETELVTIRSNDCSDAIGEGMVIWDCFGLMIDMNVANDCGINGLWMRNCEEFFVYENSFSDHDSIGTSIRDSGDMEIADNTLNDCGFIGLYIEGCENATLSGNTMAGNLHNFWLWGYRSINYHHTVDTTNTVDGKPIYYLRNVKDSTYDSSRDAGAFYAIDCDNLVIRDMTLERNGFGILLWNTSNTEIIDSVVRSNMLGIGLGNGSSDCSARYSDIYNNTENGAHADMNENRTFDAAYNWWGHDNGPLHPSLNPNGSGDVVTDFVDFIPWLPIPPEAFIDTVTPNPAREGKKVTFKGHGVGMGTTIELYVWRSSKDGEFYNDTSNEFHYSKLSTGDHTIFMKVRDSKGFWSNEVSVTLTVKEKKGDDGTNTGMIIGLVILVIIILLILLFLLGIFPKRDEDEEEKKEEAADEDKDDVGEEAGDDEKDSKDEDGEDESSDKDESDDDPEDDGDEDEEEDKKSYDDDESGSDEDGDDEKSDN